MKESRSEGRKMEETSDRNYHKYSIVNNAIRLISVAVGKKALQLLMLKLSSSV